MNNEALIKKARDIRVSTLSMILEAGSGHVGGSFSATELLVALYYDVMKTSEEVGEDDRDRFVLSKGHAAPALYSVLADKGYADKELVHTLRKLGSPFQGHPDSSKLQSLDCSTGSLGQGISVATGMAYGFRLKGSKARVFVITGDGELQEGLCWEAFEAAANFGLDNLTVIIDRNMIQLSGRTEEIMKIGDLRGKMESFGFAVDEINGHDFSEIIPALEKRVPGKPHCIIAHTVKGKGVSFMEDDPEWHGGLPKGEQIEAAFRELGGTENGR